MKKRDLLLSGLLLFSASAFAQLLKEIPHYKDDAVEMYKQDFEGSKDWNEMRLNPDPKRPTTLYTWNDKPVDSIMHVAYYAKSDSVANFSYKNIYDGSAQFKIAGVRDTVIYMYDGVMRTDATWPDDSALSFDNHQILNHADYDSQHGPGGDPEFGLDRYGENGGVQFFRYTADRSNGTANRSTSDNGDYVPEYRRNLFIRNIPIEDSSSYRVTVFIKPSKIPGATKLQKARIGLDLMRGYFHSEKPFLVNTEGKEVTQWWGGTSTEYPTFSDKTDYTDLEWDKWNKVTLMSYYANDSIGNASPYILTYYWQTDWDWKVNVDEDGMVAEEGTPKTLRYIQQPAKYFVRLSFRSDSTIFDVDNLSITKSWIGGVEYFDEMIRVDMGYETNLGALAQAALEKNKIAAVALPGKYFQVWGYYTDTEYPEESGWEEVPILSAEYQGDGFMYMWTEPLSDGSPFSLEYYDTVLVSFFNPTDNPDLQLKYTGDRYPNGMDPEWIADKDKRVVFDFHNEIAYLNPTIMTSPVTKKPVESLAQKAPILQKEYLEDGAFGLDPNTEEITVKFSKNLAFDNIGSGSTKTIVRLKGGKKNKDEYWEIEDYADPETSDGWTTIRRPASVIAENGPLEGDYTLIFMKVTHRKNPTNSKDYGDDVELNYHFGDFKADAIAEVVAYSNWRNDIEDKEASNARPIPKSVYLHTGTDPFQKGNGVENNNKCGFYNGPKDSIYVNGTYVPDDGMFYLSNRNSGVSGNLYSIVNLKKGTYSISFKLGGHSTTDIPMQLKFYAKPTGELEDGNDNGFKVLEAVTDKTILEAGKKPKVNQGGSYSTTTAWKDGIETCSYSFTVPADGDYVFEWVAEGSSNYNGYCISNYWITTGGDMSFASVAGVNGAIALANAKKKIADDTPDKYKGADYNTLVGVINAASEFIPTQKASYVNLPSEYTDEANDVTAAANAFQLHIDTVDDYYKAYAEAESKLAEYGEGTEKEKYAASASVKALSDLIDEYSTFDCTIQEPGKIAAAAKVLRDAVTAVNARQTLVDNLNKALADAKTTLTNKNAAKYATEYGNLSDAIDLGEIFIGGDQDVEGEDEEIIEMTNELTSAKMALDIKLLAAEVVSTRVKALYSLATGIEATYVDDATAQSVAERVQNLDFDDDELAEIIMAAVKAAMYKKVAIDCDTAKVEGLDLTSFIKNYHLYATVNGPVVDNTDLQLPGDRNNDKCKAENNPGSSFMHIKHEWGQDALGKTIWVLMYGKAFDDVYPGWTVESFITGNHSMVTPDDATDTYSNLSKGIPVFDGKLTMDWNSKAELKQSVVNLPAGLYTLNVAVSKNGGDASSLTATTSNDTYSKNMSAGNTDAKVQNILVGADGKMSIDFTLTSGGSNTNNASQADNFTLTYVGVDKNFDYTAAYENAQKELDNIITVVDFAEVAGAAEYEYYTLNWIKVEAPEKGQVYFRKLGNVVEKIIFK